MGTGLTMRTRSSARVIAAALAVAVVVAACSSGSTDPAAEGEAGSGVGETAAVDPSAPPEWLFTVQSEGPSAFDAATSTLTVPARSVTAFTDRPARDSRVTSTAAFADLFAAGGPDSFSEDPPNAVLTYWDAEGAGGTPRSVVCEVVGDVRADGGALSMRLQVLQPEGVVLPAQLFHASLFVDDLACEPTPGDQEIIEYFNEQVFLKTYAIATVASGPDAYQLSLACPDPGASWVPAGLEVSLTVGPTETTCAPGQPPVSVSVTVGATPSLGCIATGCNAMVTARNAQTGTPYSQTVFELRPQPGTFLPDLEPATLPLCDNTPNPCILAGTCTFSTAEYGALELCPTPNCGQPT